MSQTTYLIDADMNNESYDVSVLESEICPDGVYMQLDERSDFVLITRRFIDLYHKLFRERDRQGNQK